MRNATIQDVKEAQRTGVLKEDVMYGGYVQKLHGKRVEWLLDAFLKRSTGVKDVVLAETAQGEIIDVSLHMLEPLSKGGSAFTPRKPRPKPVKGTRPERKIPVAADTEIKVGDVVLLKLDRERALVTGKTEQGYILKLIGRKEEYYIHMIYKRELDSIILPYEESEKKEVTYQIGDRFDNNVYGPHILAQTGAYRIALSSL